MQEQSAQTENELWNAVGEVLDTEMSTVEDVLESLARTQKGNVKSSIENCMTILYRDPVLKDAICKNELTNKTDIVKQLLWKRNGRLQVCSRVFLVRMTTNIQEKSCVF